MSKIIVLIFMCGILSACAHSKDMVKGSNDLSDQSATATILNQLSQIAELQRQLTESNIKVKKLEEELKVVLPPSNEKAISIDELCAVSEIYLDKVITVQGRLNAAPVFSDPVTIFRLGGKLQCSVRCQFKKGELDPQYRRLLSNINLDQSILVTGKFISPNVINVTRIGIVN